MGLEHHCSILTTRLLNRQLDKQTYYNIVVIITLDRKGQSMQYVLGIKGKNSNNDMLSSLCTAQRSHERRSQYANSIRPYAVSSTL
jgi:hypothetical protein